MAVDINIDGIDIFGRTHDVTMIGLGKSEPGRPDPDHRGDTGPHVVA